MHLLYSTPLRSQRILVVEDSYLVAQELTEALEREGANVIGPVSTLYDAQRLAIEIPKLDTAVLDVYLHGEMIWPVADILSHRHVKLVFATGYAAASLKERYKRCQVAEKPTLARAVARLLTVEPPTSQGHDVVSAGAERDPGETRRSRGDDRHH